MIQHLKHMMIIPDLRRPGGILLVGRPLRDLVPHLGKVHVDAGVVLDELLELLEHGDQVLLAVLVDMVDVLAQPGLVDAVVRWEPVAGSEGGQYSK